MYSSLWIIVSMYNQDTLMECDQMRFTFQHSSSCGPHMSTISVAGLASYWSKMLSPTDMILHQRNYYKKCMK